MNIRWHLLTISCVAAVGCAKAATVVASPPPPQAALSSAACQREHVYVFLLNGLDPFWFCKFNKMPDYVRSLGYEHVWIGQMGSKARFLKDIRQIRASDPCARVVLIGFSTGANTVCHMCKALKKDGCAVDLLVYLGGCHIYNRDSSRPANALKIVNIRDSGLVLLSAGLLRGQDVDGAQNIRIPGLAFHSLTPVNTVTQETLAVELDRVAGTIPLPAVAGAEPAAPTAKP